MGVYYDFDDVDVFTTATVGRPGERTFFLQVRADGERIAIKCEKQQTAAVVQYLRRVLSDLPPPEDRPLPAALELAPPVEAVFVLGPIGLGYDNSSDRVLVQLEELGEVDEEGEPIDTDRGHVRVSLTRGQATAFCDHAEQIIAAGRPDCPWCGDPIDPDGHPCRRMN
jgi:uncharacterized repeat protein (TIGR03847 family)